MERRAAEEVAKADIDVSIYISGFTRINVDEHFVLSLGAKVNNNKCRVSLIYTEQTAEGVTDR